MGTSATASKNKWNANHYERIAISVPIGERERYKHLAEKLGISVNQMFIQAVEEYVKNHSNE